MTVQEPDEADEASFASYDGNAAPAAIRHLSLTGGIALVIGMIVGGGIFAIPGIIAAQAGSVGSALLVWLVVGGMAWITGQCYTELGTSIPLSGGPQAYLAHIYGPFMSFAFSWSNIFAVRPASMAMLGLICSAYICRAVYHIFVQEDPDSDTHEDVINAVPEIVVKLGAIAITLLLAVINAFSLKSGPRTTLAITIVKLASLIGIIVMAVVACSTGWRSGSYSTSIWEGSATTPGPYAVAVVAVMHAYSGITAPGEVAGEFINTKRDLPLSLSIGLGVIIILYTTVNVAYFAVLPKEVVQKTETVALDFGYALMGPLGGTLFTIIVAISSFGALNAVFFTGSRIIQATARDGFLPAKLAELSVTRKTPLNATILQTCLGLLLIIIGNFRFLLIAASVAATTLDLATVGGMFILHRRDPHADKPYKAPVYAPWVCVCTMTMALLMSVWEKPVEAVVAYVFVASAYPVYILTQRWHRTESEDETAQEDAICLLQPSQGTPTSHKIRSESRTRRSEMLYESSDVGGGEQGKHSNSRLDNVAIDNSIENSIEMQEVR